MKKARILFAFVLGCLVTSIIGPVVIHVSAQGQNESGNIHVCADKTGVLRIVAPAETCPNGQRSLLLKKATSDVDLDQPKEKQNEGLSQIDQTILEDLNRRLMKLESEDCSSFGKSKVVAPFQVVDRAGHTIFYVNDGIANLFNQNHETAAVMEASSKGGTFYSRSSGSGLFTALGANGESFGLSISEGGDQRVELGRRPAGNYSLIFSKGGNKVAAIGETKDGSGQAVVGDSQGVAKAIMNIGQQDGRGRVWITDNGSDTLAVLAEGDHGGGVMAICKRGGCNPPMVDAGDAGGYGLVRTGPLGFNPGLGIVGAPGSVLVGKK